ncbi:hypothetical protein DVR12_09220 [Chitinophaga silvatica]|uniref:ABC transporter permease n=1 Tax=Chitinophaga silvatica TaxID=2282649 RepID=A0A3E1YCP1_9BACT|nr:FtsX-like permease family protein [Chitinophaga silvatica]RFS24053.1 hypothetical protein DVR12_09220 [Chitinophaga silvatica]
MFRNYLLVAIRNIRRNKIFSLINVLGLVIGIAASTFMFVLIYYELTYDKDQADKSRIFRVNTSFAINDAAPIGGVCFPLVQAVKEEVPEIEIAAPVFSNHITRRITVDGKNFKNQKLASFAFIDEDYFKLIKYEWLLGSPASSLNDPFSIVLTKSQATEYFPNLSIDKISGKQIILDDTIPVTVTGIVADLKGHSDFSFTQFLPLKISQTAPFKNFFHIDSWGNLSSSNTLMVKLRSESDTLKVRLALNAIQAVHTPKDEVRTMGLEPFKNIHFTPYNTFNRTASISSLLTVATVAGLLLLLAIINFINLTTAKASSRARETGIRKSLGSTKKQLIWYYLIETAILTFIAAIIALLLLPVLVQLFKGFLPQDFLIEDCYKVEVILFLLGVSTLTTIIAGIYPAVVVARYQPVEVLKSQVIQSGGGSWIRKTLIVSQFTVAQCFIIGALLVSKQINFAINRDPGFSKDAVLVINTPDRSNPLHLRQQLMERINTLPGVQTVSLGAIAPLASGAMFYTISYTNESGDQSILTEMRFGDSLYLPLYKLKLLAGRNITTSESTTEWVANEQMVKAMGLRSPDEAIGKLVNGHPIVGVVGDFNTYSAQSPIRPLLLGNNLKESKNIHILLQQSGNRAVVWKQAIEKMEGLWKNIYPKSEFEYSFLDQAIENMYYADKQVNTLLNFSAILAMLISSIGLLGLVIFTTNKRTREIGIRKVLGASVWQVTHLLTLEFIKLVAIAFVFSIPLAWWYMNKWLSAYAYRTEMSWWVFVLGGIIMIILALITISFKTIRAATGNPVTALKTE